jgi:integrase
LVKNSPKDATKTQPKMTIREVVKNGLRRWCLDAGVWQGRRRQFFHKSKRAAEMQLAELKRDRAAVGNAWADLSPQDRAEVVRVLGEMRAASVTLAGVWQTYQTGATGRAVSNRSLGEAIGDLIAAKRKAGRRESYLANLAVHLKNFAKGRESLAVASVAMREVEAYVGAGKSPGSRATRANRLSTLLSFAVRRGWRSDNPCKLLERQRLDEKPPSVLTVGQCRALLAATLRVDAGFVPHLALLLFAGVRPAEARRLSWADVDLDAGLLRIEAAASKVRQRRVVELPGACLKWLRLGGDLPAANVRYRMQAAARAAGIVPWPRDVLRHSAASYWHALKGEVVTARNLGHSESVLHRHYRAVVTPEQAREFFEMSGTFDDS